MTKRIQYFIKSKVNGKYMSNLFEDAHEKRFASVNPCDLCAYYYTIKQIALDIATKENAEIFEVQP